MAAKVTVGSSAALLGTRIAPSGRLRLDARAFSMAWCTCCRKQPGLSLSTAESEKVRARPRAAIAARPVAHARSARVSIVAPSPGPCLVRLVWRRARQLRLAQFQKRKESRASLFTYEANRDDGFYNNETGTATRVARSYSYR